MSEKNNSKENCSADAIEAIFNGLKSDVEKMLSKYDALLKEEYKNFEAYCEAKNKENGSDNEVAPFEGYRLLMLSAAVDEMVADVVNRHEFVETLSDKSDETSDSSIIIITNETGGIMS